MNDPLSDLRTNASRLEKIRNRNRQISDLISASSNSLAVGNSSSLTSVTTDGDEPAFKRDRKADDVGLSTVVFTTGGGIDDLTVIPSTSTDILAATADNNESVCSGGLMLHSESAPVLCSTLGECRSRLSLSPIDKREPDRKSTEPSSNMDDLQNLLSLESAKERESKKVIAEISELINQPTAKEKSVVAQFRSVEGTQVQEFCSRGTKEECARETGTGKWCERLHFRKIIQKHTDISLGDCSFLNTCFHMNTCKYIHYHIDNSTIRRPEKLKGKGGRDVDISCTDRSLKLIPAQWVQCDIRSLDLTVLGKFAIIMADPPWDIHMELPYGTMKDEEMLTMEVKSLQDEGLIFLWVTGRAMELGRDCLKKWGYDQCDEIIWVKTNQLQRIIRTGRTGHWLNHGKEHCLVGRKGSLSQFNRGLDCDVIVAEVRETSHKPDEIYGLIERLSPGTRKVELFGRSHNVQPNWVTLGNQLDGVKLVEPDMVARFEERYPDGNCMAGSKGNSTAKKH